MSYLHSLISKSVYILREIKVSKKKTVTMWSTGKDSTTVLDLHRKAFFGKVPWPVVHIDTDCKFEQIYEFRDKLAEEWDLDLWIIRNEKALKDGVSPFTSSREECCTKLKTEALKKFVEREGVEIIIVSIRHDEHGIRGMERFVSPRDKLGHWNIWDPEEFVSLQPVELGRWNLYFFDFLETSHLRVHPIFHWWEEAVWEYIRQYKLPVNPLYFSKGGYRYRSLGCMPCTEPIPSIARDLDGIVKEVHETPGRERNGRSQDKEETYTMERLRYWGYL